MVRSKSIIMHKDSRSKSKSNQKRRSKRKSSKKRSSKRRKRRSNSNHKKRSVVKRGYQKGGRDHAYYKLEFTLDNNSDYTTWETKPPPSQIILMLSWTLCRLLGLRNQHVLGGEPIKWEKNVLKITTDTDNGNTIYSTILDSKYVKRNKIEGGGNIVRSHMCLTIINEKQYKYKVWIKHEFKKVWGRNSVDKGEEQYITFWPLKTEDTDAKKYPNEHNYLHNRTVDNNEQPGYYDILYFEYDT